MLAAPPERPTEAQDPARATVAAVGHAFGQIERLGEGYGFRKVRQALGVKAFGVNVLVYPPGAGGITHYHERQDELYFVHRGTARFEVDGETRELGPGGLCHVESTTPRNVSNAGDDDLVLLVVGAQDGYVGRDGHLADENDLARRQALARGELAG
jgi:mannose-6-phosphate isomerase-like protein (cupin superfamily)